MAFTQPRARSPTQKHVHQPLGAFTSTQLDARADPPGCPGAVWGQTRTWTLAVTYTPWTPWSCLPERPRRAPGVCWRGHALEPPARASRSARRAGAPAEQAGSDAFQDELPRAPGRGWRRPGPRRLPGRARPHRHRADSTHRRPARTPLAGPFPAPCGQHAQKTSTPRRPPSTRRTHPDPHPSNQPRQDHCKHPRSREQ